MGCGSVLHMTGESKFTELGGLYKKMPWTFVFTLIGGLSISAFPLFSGFVSKSMIVRPASRSTSCGSASCCCSPPIGTFLHTGLKVPYFIWFGKNKLQAGRPGTVPPIRRGTCSRHGIAALCIFIGCYTPYLYKMLPYQTWPRVSSLHRVPRLRDAADPALHRLGFFLLLKLKKLVPTPAPSASTSTGSTARAAARSSGWPASRSSRGYLVGELYRVGGLVPLMKSARSSAMFDNARDRRRRRRPRLHRPGNRRGCASPSAADAAKPHLRLRRGAGLILAFSLFKGFRHDTPGPTRALPLLSVLIFSPLLAAAVAALIRRRALLRWWTLGVHHGRRALLLQLYWALTPAPRRSSSANSIPGFRLKINYTLGIDGISLLLVLLTTLITPLCVLASWRYIKTRVKEFMICLLVMETAMVGVFCALDSSSSSSSGRRC
jgi:hypothetical protein